MQEKYPYIQWVEYINVLLPSPLSIDENEVIIVAVPTFFESLGKVLEETPKRVIANYMMWQVAVSSVDFLTNKLRQRQLEFSTIISGNQERAPRWKECIDLTTGR